MDNSRQKSQSEITLKYGKENKLNAHLGDHIVMYEKSRIQDSPQVQFAKNICRYVRGLIKIDNEIKINKYLQKKAASDEYKQYFGQTPIGPASGNGEGGSTSVATWSGGQDSTSAEKKTSKKSDHFDRDLNETFDLNEYPNWR